MKQVRETSAGKSIGAWVILKGKREVATAQAYYGNRVLVNVFNYGDKNKTAAKGLHFQAGSAGGYGYDKFTAALSGLEIDGHKLTNHCGARLKGNLFPQDFKAPKGYRLANFKTWEWSGDERVNLPPEKQGYTDCYRIQGLDYLTAIGYTVIRAI